MTGPELFRESLRLRASAREWMDADTGWKGTLSAGERLARQAADLADAQVCATLSLAAATALGNEGEARTMPSQDRAAWFDAAAECRKAAAE